jgi:diaminopimelate epimerase
MTTTIQIGLSKHEAAGNDFLIMIDLHERVKLTDDEVRFLTDRHRGVGADGLIVVTGPSGGGDVTMSLRNQDGSPAEISGNGLRCVVHEVVRAGMVAAGEFSVMTGSGLRRVFCGEPEGRTAWTSADMGEVEIVSVDDAARRATLSVGNPHLVIVRDSLEGLDIAAEGARLQETRPGGINVEWISPAGEGRLALAVFERGVGPTLACGSGSCAAAVAARALDVSGDVVTIDNPGGPLEVSLEGNRATLSGPASVVADLTVSLERGS